MALSKAMSADWQLCLFAGNLKSLFQENEDISFLLKTTEYSRIFGVFSLVALSRGVSVSTVVLTAILTAVLTAVKREKFAKVRQITSKLRFLFSLF